MTRQDSLGWVILLCGCSSASGASGARVQEVSLEPVAMTSAAPLVSASAPPLLAEPAPIDVGMSDEKRKELEMLELLENQGTASGAISGLGVGQPSQVWTLSLAGSAGPHGSGGALIGPSAPAHMTGPQSKVEMQTQMQGAIENFDVVMASVKTGFRRCHQRMLQNNPSAAGALTLSANVDANGSVTSVKVVAPNRLLGEAVNCSQARLGSAQFAPPKNGKAVITLHIDFLVAP